MARTTGQPSTATRRNTRTTKSDTNGLGSLDEQNQDNRLDDNDERREGLSSVRDEQDTDRDNSRDERGFGDSRENTSGRNERSVQTSPAKIAAAEARMSLRRNRRLPVTSSWRITPSAKMSEERVTGCPRRCSGAM